jgi:hypothetical protein
LNLEYKKRHTGKVASHFVEDDTYLVVYKDGQYTVDPKSDIARDDARRSTSFAASLSGARALLSS